MCYVVVEKENKERKIRGGQGVRMTPWCGRKIIFHNMEIEEVKFNSLKKETVAF